ncbi:MAG: hypothetical protein ACKVRN_07565 [Pyrinomonadaceae bacterium]
MNRFKTLITISAFSLMVLLLPAIASAQYGGNRPYYGNNDSRSVLKNLKRDARSFQNQIDRDLDRSRYDGTNREDRINGLAQEFRNAVNSLNNDDFNRNDRNNDRDDRYRNGRNNRNDNSDVSRVLNIANQIDRSLNRSGVSGQSRNIWTQIRNNLNQLGYNSNNDDWYDRNNRRNRGSNNGGYNQPSWWPF